jgi:hypothetical protein
MFAHGFGRILLSEGAFKVPGTLLKLFAQRCFVVFKLLQGLEIGLHLVPWNGNLAAKDACHPHRPMRDSMAMEISAVMTFRCMKLSCTVRQDKIQRKQGDGIYGNDRCF